MNRKTPTIEYLLRHARMNEFDSGGSGAELAARVDAVLEFCADSPTNFAKRVLEILDGEKP